MWKHLHGILAQTKLCVLNVFSLVFIIFSVLNSDTSVKVRQQFYTHNFYENTYNQVFTCVTEF
jgi:hypothetical protein